LANAAVTGPDAAGAAPAQNATEAATPRAAAAAREIPTVRDRWLRRMEEESLKLVRCAG
jgi:hypothetical protein